MNEETVYGIPLSEWKLMGANSQDDHMYEMIQQADERTSELRVKEAHLDLDQERQMEEGKQLMNNRKVIEIEIRDSESDHQRSVREEKERKFAELQERQNSWPSKAEEEGLHGM